MSSQNNESVAVTEMFAWARDCAASAGCEAESEAYLEQVAAWRECWRPSKVRVLLVAESHVAEQPGDSSVRVRVPLPAGEPLPPGYCRLVYCLGYGETQICEPRPALNGGTWQFWDLFGHLTSGPGNRQPRKHESSLENRLLWKVQTLETLRERGIWLVDAAVIGFYSPGGGRPFTGRRYVEFLRTSFERFVWPSVASEPIELVCLIGRGVARSLAGVAEIAQAMVISQPQDRNFLRYRADIARLRTALDQIR